MYGLFSHARRVKPKAISRRTRLGVELLETRECPATITLNTPTVLPGHQVLLTGQVSAADPADFAVTFAGAAAGQTTTNGQGAFSLVTSDASLGTVLATCQKANETATASGSIADAAPVVSLSLVYNSASTVTLSGTVTDIDAAGETVVFTGLTSESVTCDANGYFSLTTSVTGLGAIDATTTDVWDQGSNTAEVTITAAPTVSLAAQVLAGHQVRLTGTVTGAYAAGATVTFSGAVTGNTTADANGNYTYTTSSASLGTVSAVAEDQQQHASASTSATVAVSAPTITLAVTSVGANTVTLSGHVTDLDAAGETVNITGAMQGSVTADANGNFSFTMAATALGTVDVSTTDAWGQDSNTAEVAANSFPPVIHTFTATHSSGNDWLFQGTVIAPNCAGLIIRFGGLTSLAGRTATVAADGTFSLVAFLQSGESGTATAQTTDAQNQDSNLFYTNVS